MGVWSDFSGRNLHPGKPLRPAIVERTANADHAVRSGVWVIVSLRLCIHRALTIEARGRFVITLMCDSIENTQLVRREQMLDQAHPAGSFYGLMAAVDAQFSIDIFHMGAHGIDRDDQRVRQLLGGHLTWEQLQYIVLTRAE